MFPHGGKKEFIATMITPEIIEKMIESEADIEV
jgi:hypothetical protein